MKRALLALTVATLVGLSSAGGAFAFDPAPGTSRFTDLAGHWAAAQVDRAAGLHLVAGYPDGSFHPDGLVTRAEFIKMAVQVRGLAPRAGTGGFADVDGHWVAAQGYLQAAVDGGLVVPADFAADGVAPRYEPDAPITRQEMVVIAVRAMGKQGEAMALRGAPLLFIDVPAWASGFVAVATSAGIVQGYTDGSFGGRRNLSRAEATVIALRLLELIVSEGTVPAPAGLEPQAPRTVPVWEAASWQVGTLPVPPDPANAPTGVMALTAAPDGTLYFAADGQIFRVGADGAATLVAEVPVSLGPNGIAADNTGNLYVSASNQILRISPDAPPVPWAGSGGSDFADGVGTAAGIVGISGMCSDPGGNIYVTESAGRVRKIDAAGRVTTLAGMTPLQQGALWSPWGYGGGGGKEGPGYLVDVGQPPGACAADGAGNVYVADNGVIRRIRPDGRVSWLAGNPAYTGYADGLTAEAQFRAISAMATDAWGNLWVADAGNQRIRRVTPDGRVYTVAGGGFAGYPQGNGLILGYTGSHVDGPGPDARFSNPVALAVSGGKLYVAENGDMYSDPDRAPGFTPRHLRVITGSAAAYSADKVAAPLAGVGLVPAAGVPGKVPQGPVTVAYALYAPVEALRLTVDGDAVTSGSEQPYTASWNAAAAAPGAHDLQIAVRLPDAGWTDGGRFPVEVLSAPPPDLFDVHYALITPWYGSWIKGSVTLTAAGDGGPLEFRIDGQSLGRGSGRVLSVVWDSTAVADGDHTLELGHLIPGQAQLSYDPIPVQVINHSAPPREDDLGPGLRVFLGGNRLTYKSAAPKLVGDIPYVPFWETMDRAGALMSRSGAVLTARKGDRVTTLNVDTGDVIVTDPRFPDRSYTLQHTPIQSGDVVLVPYDFVADVLNMNAAWLPTGQDVWWW